MYRYSKLLAGASWMGEFGNPETDDWAFLKKYSPYHRLKKGAEYPPILFTTSTRDDRVHPGHARKARPHPGPNPRTSYPAPLMTARSPPQMVGKMLDLDIPDVYYYENIEGGHGGAADNKQRGPLVERALHTV